MKLAIHQPQYMPWVGYFHKIASCDLFVLLDDVQFKKNEWQHRNRIRSAVGWQWLSVPNGYKLPQKINEVAIDYATPWPENHLKSLQMCYSRAPYYEQYRALFEVFYSQRPRTIDLLNIASVNLLAGALGITVPMAISSSCHCNGVSTERLVAICKHFKADTYLAGAGGHDYMDLALFAQAGITVEFQEFAIPVYNQHHSTSATFIGGLSAIDLLFNCGEKSLEVLMN